MSFDPYHQWLGIPPREQPPNHYQLLGLNLYEPNGDVIENAADRQMRHVRSFQSGKHGDDSQKLLNEIAAARLCLLDVEKKAAYDARLKKQLAKANKQKTLAKAQPLSEKPLESPAKPAGDRKPGRSAVTSAGKPRGKLASAASDSETRATIPPIAFVVGGGALVVLLLIVVSGVFLVSAIFFGDDGTNSQPALALQPPPVVTPPQHRPEPDGRSLPIPQGHPPNELTFSPQTGNGIGETAGQHSGLTNETATKPTPEPKEPMKPSWAWLLERPPQQSDTRTELPSAKSREQMRKKIAGIFRLDDIRTFQEKKELVGRLIKTGEESKEEAVTQFELFNLAREVAASAGDVRLAFGAVKKLEEHFQVDGLAVRIDTIAKTSRASASSELRKQTLEEGLQLVDLLLSEERFGDASKLTDGLIWFARDVRQHGQTAALNQRRDLCRELAQAQDDVQSQIQTLVEEPENKDAALAIGKHFAFLQGDWQRGLPLLAAGSDEKLQQIAEREMALPKEQAEWNDLADTWLELSQNSEGITAQRQKARAAMWYRRIEQSGISGLAKIEVERRLKELSEVTLAGGDFYEPNKVTPAAVVKVQVPTNWPQTTEPIDLLKWTDPLVDTTRGNWRLTGDGIRSGQEGTQRIQLPCIPPQEYDLDVILTCDKPALDLSIGLIASGTQVGVVLEGWVQGPDQCTSGLGEIDGRGIPDNATTLKGRKSRVGEENHVRCQVRNSAIRVILNGELLFQWEGDHSRLSQWPHAHVEDARLLFLGTFNRHITFHSAKLTPVRGQATLLRHNEPIDVLALVDTWEDSVTGMWERRGEEIISPRDYNARLKLPVVPPREYIVDLEVSCDEPVLEANLGLVGGGGQFSVTLEGYNDVPPTVSGLSNIDGQRPTYNDTRKEGRYSKLGERNRIRCEVRESLIRVACNGETIVDWRGDQSRLKRDAQRIASPRILYLGAHGRRLTFHRYELTPITGGASLVRMSTQHIQGDSVLASLPEGPTVTYTPGQDPRGLHLIAYEDGRFAQQSIDGNAVAQALDKHLYFQVDDRFLHSQSMQTLDRIIVVANVLDRQRGWVELQYDAHSAAYRTTYSKVRLAGSQKWIDVSFELPGALLANRQNGGADFRLRFGDNRPAVRSVSLRRVPVSSNMIQGEVVDLIPLVDIGKDVLQGGFRRDGNELIAENRPYSRLQIPFRPGSEYVFEVEFTRTAGKEDFVIGLPVGGERNGMLCLDGFGGSRSVLALGHSLSGRTQWDYGHGLFVNGQRYKVTCDVREEGVQILVDGKRVFRIQGRPDRAFAFAPWMPPNRNVLAIGTKDSRYQIHSMTLTPIYANADEARREQLVDDEVYLDDLKELVARVGYGILAKHGQTGFLPDDGPQKVNVQRKPYAHSLTAHPSPDGSSYVSYILDGKYDKFSATAAIIDQYYQDGFSSSLQFKIVGDGRELWKSGALTSHGQTSNADVSVRGVRRLDLIISCTGPSRFAWAVWLDPKLTP